MKATRKRHIIRTNRYDALFPNSINKDTVVVGNGNASLSDTVDLMQEIIATTLADTKAIAKLLKGASLRDSCKNIWEFVYKHIQYTMDKTGIEQVRRPSRTWKDRYKGVDCDCYTVFIGSVLSNLRIPFSMRITKYKQKKHFQHVYPIVPTASGHITIDCVTDAFDYEVPYSEKKDISISDQLIKRTGSVALSGVDELAIGVDGIVQPSIPLRESIAKNEQKTCIPIVERRNLKKSTQQNNTRTAKIISPFRFKQEENKMRTKTETRKNYLPLVWVSGFTLLTGVGFLKLFETTK